MTRFNNFNTNFNTNLTIEKILATLEITSQNYYWALSVSSDSQYQIHFKRISDSCFVNNHNLISLKAWEALKTYQVHLHPKTCEKVKNTDCCFNFRRFFSHLLWNPYKMRVNMKDFVCLETEKISYEKSKYI